PTLAGRRDGEDTFDPGLIQFLDPLLETNVALDSTETDVLVGIQLGNLSSHKAVHIANPAVLVFRDGVHELEDAVLVHDEHALVHYPDDRRELAWQCGAPHLRGRVKRWHRVGSSVRDDHGTSLRPDVEQNIRAQ